MLIDCVGCKKLHELFPFVPRIMSFSMMELYYVVAMG